MLEGVFSSMKPHGLPSNSVTHFPYTASSTSPSWIINLGLQKKKKGLMEHMSGMCLQILSYSHSTIRVVYVSCTHVLGELVKGPLSFL